MAAVDCSWRGMITLAPFAFFSQGEGVGGGRREISEVIKKRRKLEDRNKRGKNSFKREKRGDDKFLCSSLFIYVHFASTVFIWKSERDTRRGQYETTSYAVQNRPTIGQLFGILPASYAGEI